MRTEILIGLRDDAGIIGPVSHRLPVPGDRIGRVAWTPAVLALIACQLLGLLVCWLVANEAGAVVVDDGQHISQRPQLTLILLILICSQIRHIVIVLFSRSNSPSPFCCVSTGST